jgi:hypothetical protein
MHFAEVIGNSGLARQESPRMAASAIGATRGLAPLIDCLCAHTFPAAAIVILRRREVLGVGRLHKPFVGPKAPYIGRHMPGGGLPWSLKTAAFVP